MKKIISIILATAILVSVTAAAFASERIAFTPKADNPISAWALDAVAKAGENGILETDRNYTFANPITREEFCELIYNLIHNAKTDIAMLDYALNIEITDTDNEKVLELYARGIINGKTKTEFAPNDTLTREEAATIILRTVNIELSIPMHEVYYEFKDSDEISDWAKDGVQAVCNMGIMKGTGDEKFSPKGTFTVEEAITALMRIFDTYKANEEIIGGADGPTAIYVPNDNEMYSDEEIDDAIKVIVDEFQGWKGCTLTSIYYGGDELSKAHQEWADRNDADEVIVLLSSFDVDESGGDGSLNPNSTYDDWMWILVRKNGGKWMHVDHGY